MSGRTLEPGAAPEMPEEGPVASEYRQLLIPLHEDLRALKSVQSMENKAAFKATAIEKYLDWCRGAIATPEGEAAPQDEIVATCLIWAIDIRRWQLALDLAGHMTRHGLSLPEHYKRSVAALLVSEMGDAAINDPGSVPPEALQAALYYVAPAFDMKDSYRARLHRALGESLQREAEKFDPTAETAMAGGKPALVDVALAAMRRALELGKNVGVKKQIEQLEREAKKLAAAAEGN